jgi:hypothetical protein
MWSCSFTCWFFQNGCRFHGNGKNAKKLKKHKNDHSRLLQGFIKFDQGISEKCVGQTFGGRKKEEEE